MSAHLDDFLCPQHNFLLHSTMALFVLDEVSTSVSRTFDWNLSMAFDLKFRSLSPALETICRNRHEDGIVRSKSQY